MREKVFKRKELKALVRDERLSSTFSISIVADRVKGIQIVSVIINHAVEYVNGHVHTNGIENLWALLKRGLHGTYISVEPFHLDAYLKEQVFRCNNRKDADDFTRFATCIQGIVGKRLTYKALTQRPTDIN